MSIFGCGALLLCAFFSLPHLAVLFLRCHTAAYVPLSLVALEYLPHLAPQPRVNRAQPFGHILMHGRFRNAEPLCGLPDRRVVFNYIFPQLSGSGINRYIHISLLRRINR